MREALCSIRSTPAAETDSNVDFNPACGHLYNDVRYHEQIMKQKVETLQADLSRRQESYIRRERAFHMRIEELEEEVGSLKVQNSARTRSKYHTQHAKMSFEEILDLKPQMYVYFYFDKNNRG